MATIEILFHKYERVERSFVTVLPDESIPNKVTSEAKETVATHFTIIDAGPVEKNGRPAEASQLHVTYTSINGGPWFEDRRNTITGNNVKKDGSYGARVEIRNWEFPAWARELTCGASPVRKWIEETYPR